MTVQGVAVWGLGRHANNRIIPILNSVDELSLVGVCSRNKKTVLECALEWDCIGWVDPFEMFESETVDIIYISTPIGVHANLVTQALNADKHVWCEKPLTCNLEHSVQLIKLAKHRKLMLAECLMYLHHPQFNRTIEYAKGMEAGPVHFVSCRFGIPFLDNPGFRYDPDLCGGAFWDVGSYTISAILELFPGYDLRVDYAQVSRKENFPVDVEGRALLSCSNGAKIYLDWGTGLGYRNEIDLWAENGSLFTEKVFSKPNDYKPCFKLLDKYGNESFEYCEKVDQFAEMFINFSRITSDSGKIDYEMMQILKRAKIMDEIVNLSNRITLKN